MGRGLSRRKSNQEERSMSIYGPGGVLIPTPAIVPWRSGLFSVATIQEMPDGHYRNGVRFRAPDCGNVSTWTDLCPEDGEPDPKLPTFLNPGQVDGVGPWTIYAYINCRGYGDGGLAAMFDEARASLALGAPRAVETLFWTDELATPDSIVVNASSTTADALTPVAAVAALESYMAANYGGQATFHADRGVSAYAARDRQAMLQRDGSLQTTLGSQWAFYGGSPNTGPDGTPAPDGYAWMYATSQVYLWHSEVDTLPESVEQMLRYGPMTNEPTAIAEQVWVAAEFCARAAVLTCLSC
jgi:hypothetical protein